MASVSSLINTKLDNTTKEKLGWLLRDAARKHGVLAGVEYALTNPGADTLVNIANNLKNNFGADSLESKFMDYLMSQIHDAQAAGQPKDQICSALSRIISAYDGGMPFTQKEVGSKDFRKTNDRVILAMFGKSRSHLIRGGSFGTLSQENFQLVQKAAMGQALPEQINGVDKAVWIEEHNDFILTYRDVVHESGFSPSKEMFGDMVEGQIRNINKANLTPAQQQQLVREARGRTEDNYQSVGTAKEDAKPSVGKVAKSSKISKCPYRALALAMKMINQLAEMMCSSFQKTVGSSGFYKGLSTDEFNQMIGFGQRIIERGEDLEGFFGLATDKNGKPIIVPSSTIEIVMPDGRKMQVTRPAQRPTEEVMEALFANIGYADVYKELEIKADPKIKDPVQAELNRQAKLRMEAEKHPDKVRLAKDKVFRDKVKNKPQEVERAMKYVDGLGEKYKQWQKQHGHSKHEGDADKNLDLGIQQFDLRYALEGLKEMATKNDDAGKKAKAWLAKYEAAEDRVAAEGGFISEKLQDEIIVFYKNASEAATMMQPELGDNKALANSTNLGILSNKVEIARLIASGVSEDSPEIQRLKGVNEAYKAVKKWNIPEAHLERLNLDELVQAQYMMQGSADFIQNVLQVPISWTAKNKQDAIAFFGPDVAAELTAAGNEYPPPHMVLKLKDIAMKYLETLERVKPGKETSGRGVGEKQGVRDRGKMKKLSGYFDVREDGQVVAKPALGSSPEVQGLAADFGKLKQYELEQREKSGGLDGSV